MEYKVECTLPYSSPWEFSKMRSTGVGEVSVAIQQTPTSAAGCTATTSSKSLQLKNSKVHLDTKPPERSLLVVFFKFLSYSFCKSLNIVCRATCLTE
jgi:hypothetical protein